MQKTYKFQSQKHKKKTAKSMKSTYTTKTHTKEAQLKHFDDPCIPDHVCGLTLFDFTLTILPIFCYIFLFTAFVGPYWATLGVTTIPNSNSEIRIEHAVNSSIHFMKFPLL
jgi:hypothetical protein